MMIIPLLSLLIGGQLSGNVMADESKLKIRELAAIETQGMSIRKLESFLTRHRNDPREPIFLNRLADLHLEKSGISFQYTEGESVRTHKKFFSTSLQDAIRTLDRLIRQYPNQSMIPEAYFKRARAHRELGNITASRNDLLHLMSNHPDFPYLDSALLDLAIYAQDENHHGDALKYLSRIQDMSDSPYFEISCRKAAWSRFNLGQHRMAIHLLEQELGRYGNEKENPPELESAWQDAALFSFEGLNRKTDFPSISQVILTLEKICKIRSHNEHATCVGIAFLKMGKLLKAYRMGSELEELKNHMVRKHLSQPETLELALLLHQYWMEKREYGKIALIIEEAATIAEEQDSKEKSRILKAIRESLIDLHALTAKNVRSTQIRQLIEPLDSLTRIQLKLASANDPTSGEFRYAMAESAFSAKQYSLAVHWYSEILANSGTIPKKMTYSAIRLRWIASEYEEWKSMPANDSSKSTFLKKWIKDTELLADDSSPESESFRLEAMKVSLKQGDRSSSLMKIEDLSLNATQPTIRSEAASIVFDERMKNSETNLLVAPCERKSWLKIDSIAEPCKMIVTRHLLEKGRIADAAKQLQNIKQSPAVSLLKSEIHLKQGRRDLAILDQESWLEQTGWKDQRLAQSVFLQHWLNRNQRSYSRFFLNGKEHDSVGEPFLEPFRAAKELNDSQSEIRLNPSRYLIRFKASIRSGKPSIPLWALSALSHPEKIPYQDRLVLLQRVSTSWEQVDPYLQIRYLPLLEKRVQSTLVSIRKDGPSIAPIRGDESSIERRVQLLKDIDLVFGKVLKLDWMQLKIRTLRELQWVYRDFAKDLRKSGTPENLIQPFLSKQDELGSAEQKLTSMILQPIHPLDSSSLIDQKVLESLPEELHESWKQAVSANQPDLLHFLITQAPTTSRSDELRGMVLCVMLRDVATTEGMKLMMNGRTK